MSIAVRDYTLSSSKHASRSAGNSLQYLANFPGSWIYYQYFPIYENGFCSVTELVVRTELKTIKIN